MKSVYEAIKDETEEETIKDAALDLEFGRLTDDEFLEKVHAHVNAPALLTELLRTRLSPKITPVMAAATEIDYTSLHGTKLLEMYRISKLPALEKQVCESISEGYIPSNYSSEEDDALLRSVITPDIQTALNLSDHDKAFQFKTPVAKRESTLRRIMIKTHEAAIHEDSQRDYLVKSKGSSLCLSDITVENRKNPSLVQYKQSLTRYWSASGCRDKTQVQRILMIHDINEVLPRWKEGTPMNKICFLAHPDLPDEYFYKTMHLLGAYKDKANARRFNIVINRKITWDIIRRLIANGTSVNVLPAIEKIGGSNPLTEAEFTRWVFPELLNRSDQAAVVEKFWKILAKRTCPGIERAQSDWTLESLKEWIAFFEDLPAEKETATQGAYLLLKAKNSKDHMEAYKYYSSVPVPLQTISISHGCISRVYLWD